MDGDPAPDEPGAISAGRASLTALAGVLGAVGLMLLLVTWAATIGPDEVVRGEGNPPSYESLPSSPTPTPGEWPGSGGSRGEGGQGVLGAIVTVVAGVMASVVVLAAALSLMRWLLTRDWRLRRRESEPDPPEVAFDPLEAPAGLAETMVREAASQRELLTGGSARNAIVACWHRFEEQAALAGVRRQGWETSSEFTLRVLERLSADSEAVLDLAELYRAARHSAHDITEADRARAQVALDAVHRSLGLTAGSGPRGVA
jgi:hypothetical protein